jgi:YegS/Rv2252/BmrU family lipid kinase
LKEKTLFIINPEAGKGRGRKILPQMFRILSGYPLRTEIILTERPNHATEIVRQHRNDFKTICAAGGDGTLNEVLNGLDGTSGNTIGIIPVGSGNDFARTAGIGKNLSEALKVILGGGAKVREIDTGFLKYKENKTESPVICRQFINSAGIGFDAIVSDLIKNNSFFKGLPLYISAVIQALFMYRLMDVSCSFDGNFIIKGKKLLIAISNGKTYGGGLRVNPEAEIDDGFLDACLVADMSIGKIIREFHKFIRGTHANVEGIDIRRFKSASVGTFNPVYIHTDGEVISKSAIEVEIGINPIRQKFIFAE